MKTPHLFSDKEAFLVFNVYGIARFVWFYFGGSHEEIREEGGSGGEHQSKKSGGRKSRISRKTSKPEDDGGESLNKSLFAEENLRELLEKAEADEGRALKRDTSLELTCVDVAQQADNKCIAFIASW